MSDKPKPNSRWFQIHLSTAVLLMFLGGGLIWLNARRYETRFDGYPINAYGWPTTMYLNSDSYETARGWPVVQFRPLNALCDVLVSIVILFLAKTTMEIIIRRRERGKP
jgi:hypothetical protein